MEFSDREEFIEMAGMRVVITICTAFDTRRWQSVAESGYWVGIVLSGAVQTYHESTGTQIWRKDTKHAFWSNGELVTDHSVLLEQEPFAAVFIHLNPVAVANLLNREEMATLAQQSPYW